MTRSGEPRRSRTSGVRLLLFWSGLALAAGPAAAASQEQPAPQQEPIASNDSTDLSLLAAARNWLEVEAVARSRLDEHPEDAEATYWLARAGVARAEVLRAGRRAERERADGLLARAVELLERLEDSDPRVPADAEEWWLWARFLREQDETLPAELERRVAAGEGFATWLAASRALQEGSAQALPLLRLAGERLPARPDVALTLAEAEALAGNRAAALAAWDSAIRRGADVESALRALAVVLPAAGDAADFLARSLQFREREGGRRDAVIAWYRAWALQRLGELEQAEAELAAADLHRSPPIVVSHARLLEQLGREQEAAELLLAVEHAWDSPAYAELHRLALSLAAARLFEEALRILDALLERQPGDPDVSRNRAQLMARAGMSLDAYRDLADSPRAATELLNDAALACLGRGLVEEGRELLARAVARGDLPVAAENLAFTLLRDPPRDALRAGQLLDAILGDTEASDRALVLRHQVRLGSR